MPDSIAVFPPGWRAFNNSGALVTDGILAFFDAGTSNARTVYSDSALSTSLGTTVSCNSAGYPVSSGNVKTLIYTGSTAYKVRLTSVIAGGTVFEFDNVKGALDTSAFLTSAAVADESVIATSTNRAIVAADQGKLINANPSGGTIALTFDDASDLGDGFFITIRHDGSANQVRITGNGSDLFSVGSVTTTGFSLLGRGQSVRITCDGTGFKATGESAPFIQGNTATIVIADRLSTPPGSPTAGARYIVTSAPTGAWSGFAEHDIAEATGGGTWFKYTPSTDCGWIAYVQDEDCYYAFAGAAWRASAININGLTEDTNPDSTSDFVPLYDTSAATGKKAKPYYIPGALIAIIEDRKTVTTNGGTFTSGADRTRDLNTLVFNRNSLVSLATNQFTLPEGTWEILWSAPAYAVNEHQSFLYNVTDAAEVARGTVEAAAEVTGNDSGSRSEGSSVVTLTASKAFEIRHRCTSTASTSGFGRAASFGTEVFTRVAIRRG